MTDLRGLNWPFLASIAACVILAAPLWLVASPPMPDYPAHLASFYLIGGGASHFYKLQWAFLPNLAAEAVVPVLAMLMPLAVAAKVFLSVTVALWVLGPAAIQRALTGKSGLGALLSGAFVYNASFMWGFFNYIFAAGVSFLVFAAWIATDRERSALQHAGLAAAFTLVYFSHLFALATLLLMITCFELSALWRSKKFMVPDIARRVATLAALCAPAAFFFLVLKPSGGGLGMQFDYLDTMLERFGAAIQFQFDEPAYLLTAVLVVLLAVGLITRRLTLSPQMVVVLSVLALCTLLAPEWALGGWGVHLRLPAVLGAVTFASVDLNLPTRWMAAAITAILLLFVFQAATLATDWRPIDARYSEFRQSENLISPRARLLTVLDGDSLGWSSDQPYWHMAEFAIMDRDAFTPLLFATKGQHIIQVLPPMDRYAAASAQQGSPPDIDELNDLAGGRIEADEDIRDILPYLQFFQCHFDQAVVIHGDGPLSHVPPMLHLRQTGSFFTLYDIVPDGRCSRR
jgi:hypothetical protein